MNCSSYWREPFPAPVVESSFMGGPVISTACGASVGQGKEGGTKPQGGFAARQPCSTPSPPPALLLLCVLVFAQECKQSSSAGRWQLRSYKVVFGNSGDNMWLPSAVVLVIHQVSTCFLHSSPHLDSQVIKYCWRIETEWEMGYKKGR